MNRLLQHERRVIANGEDAAGSSWRSMENPAAARRLATTGTVWPSITPKRAGSATRSTKRSTRPLPGQDTAAGTALRERTGALASAVRARERMQRRALVSWGTAGSGVWRGM